MVDYRVLTDTLRFPEGPVVMPDGSVIVVEIASGTLARVSLNGEVNRVADVGGGPNGARLGPDGRVYICNNGGFEWPDPQGGPLLPHGPAADNKGGSIQAVDLGSGEVATLYTHCNGNVLQGPNDLIFDRHGGFWFTDHGHHGPRSESFGGIYYAHPDGSMISEQIFPFRHPNGIALSPDEKYLYVVETYAGRVWRYELSAPGQVKPPLQKFGADAVFFQSSEYRLFDSMEIDRSGNICIGTVVNGGIIVISPAGREIDFIPLPDMAVTNIAFGGDKGDKAYITMSTTGQLIEMDWPNY